MTTTDALDRGDAFVELPDARVTRIAGADARAWLNDLVTTDVASLAPGEARPSLLLAPTGRIRAQFQVAAINGAFLLIERENSFVRFHAMQSAIVFGALCVAWLIGISIPILGWLLSFIIIPPVSAALWLILMFKAYQGERFKLPIAGDMAEQRT